MNKIKLIFLTLVISFSFSLNVNSKPVPASFADLAEKLMPSVVNISTTTTVVVVEIFTTEGINRSAKSANDAGTEFELEFVEIDNVKKKLIINVFNVFILLFNKVNNYKS